MIITKQMVRDHLTFKGPMNARMLSEKLGQGQKTLSRVYFALRHLKNSGQVAYCTVRHHWYSLITL